MEQQPTQARATQYAFTPEKLSLDLIWCEKYSLPHPFEREWSQSGVAESYSKTPDLVDHLFDAYIIFSISYLRKFEKEKIIYIRK